MVLFLIIINNGTKILLYLCNKLKVLFLLTKIKIGCQFHQKKISLFQEVVIIPLFYMILNQERVSKHSKDTIMMSIVFSSFFISFTLYFFLSYLQIKINKDFSPTDQHSEQDQMISPAAYLIFEQTEN